jgi:tetratricopeptide (TPR) repeat protein
MYSTSLFLLLAEPLFWLPQYPRVMKKEILLSLFMLATMTILRAQDSLVFHHDLQFSSNFEQEAFDRLARKDIDVFALLMANGNLVTENKIKEYSLLFQKQVDALKKQISGKKPERQTKMVYDEFEKRFLKKFELNSRFEEVFYNGQYNSVSATALYAMAFERMSIPYSIKEEPTHVYIVAYPQQERIVLQTTTSTATHMVMSPAFKLEYVKTLKAQKVITGRETEQDVNTLFDRYYFGNQMDIDLVKLAGIQYLNEGLVYVGERKFEEAFAKLEKAYFLYPSERVAYTLLVTGIMAFADRKVMDSGHAVMLSKISRFIGFNITEESICREFGLVTEKLLFTEGRTQEYDQYFKVLISHINNEKLKDELSFIYYFESARAYHNRGRHTESLPFLEKALTLKPQHLDVQAMFLWAIALELQDHPEQEAEKMIEGYAQRFPELQKNNLFGKLQGAVYLTYFYRNYADGKIKEGERYRLLFEKVADQYSTVRMDPNQVGEAYSAAAVYYYKKGQVAKARALIETGLKYAPGSYELNSRKAMIR